MGSPISLRRAGRPGKLLDEFFEDFLRVARKASERASSGWSSLPGVHLDDREKGRQPILSACAKAMPMSSPMWVKNAMLREPVASPIQAIDMPTDGLADKPAANMRNQVENLGGAEVQHRPHFQLGCACKRKPWVAEVGKRVPLGCCRGWQ